jgi:hypothetical protein
MLRGILPYVYFTTFTRYGYGEINAYFSILCMVREIFSYVYLSILSRVRRGNQIYISVYYAYYGDVTICIFQYMHRVRSLNPPPRRKALNL